MPNHYHFLIRQNGSYTAGTFIQRIFNSYTKAINKRYDRSGAVHVDDKNYLIHLCRYIHCNPLKAHLVEDIEDWPYSNYLEWMNLGNGKLYDSEFVKYYFPSKQEYKVFVDEYESPKKLEQYLF